jgi:branched-chain amino acid aminotransferase
MIHYINGDFTEENSASIPISNRGFLIGDGIFETIPIYNGVPYRLQDHLARLLKSADILYFPIDQLNVKIPSIIQELIHKNNLSNSDSVIRITLTRGNSKRGIDFDDETQSQLLITINSWERTFLPPIKLTLSSVMKNESSPLSKIKSTNFLDAILAKHQAKNNGFDDAVFLNSKEHITEATTSNIFIVKNKTLYTPPISDGVLPGITRLLVHEICNFLDISIQEISLSIADIYAADELFLSNSIKGIQPVSIFQKKKFPQLADNITNRIIQSYSKKISELY